MYASFYDAVCNMDDADMNLQILRYVTKLLDWVRNRLAGLANKSNLC